MSILQETPGFDLRALSNRGCVALIARGLLRGRDLIQSLCDKHRDILPSIKLQLMLAANVHYATSASLCFTDYCGFPVSFLTKSPVDITDSLFESSSTLSDEIFFGDHGEAAAQVHRMVSVNYTFLISLIELHISNGEPQQRTVELKYETLADWAQDYPYVTKDDVDEIAAIAGEGWQQMGKPVPRQYIYSCCP